MKQAKIKRKHKLQLSSISLRDTKSAWRDDGKRSVTYFCKEHPVRVDEALMNQLKNIFTEIGDKNLRLCLHKGPDAIFHEMIILKRKIKYYRPHKHLGKGETFHIIEGQMGVFSFDVNGNVVDASILELNSNVIYKVKNDMYHAVMPITDFVIYHESKPGPFTREGDSIYPTWAPDGDDAHGIEKYTTYLRGVLAI